jgi:hypothetical protein
MFGVKPDPEISLFIAKAWPVLVSHFGDKIELEMFIKSYTILSRIPGMTPYAEESAIDYNNYITRELGPIMMRQLSTAQSIRLRPHSKWQRISRAI